MKTKSIGFGEAVRTLAAEAGMQPYKFSNFDQKKDLRFKTYKNIFKDYSNHFKQELFKDENNEPLQYLLKRGLKKILLKSFNLVMFLGKIIFTKIYFKNILKKK